MATQLTSKEAFAKLPQRLHSFFIKYPPRPFAQYKDGPSVSSDPLKNPFFPNKNLETGNWHGAKYSRRKSADLYKMAKKFGIQDLLPPTPRKFHEDKYVNKKWIDSMVNPGNEARDEEIAAKIKARKEAIAKMDDIIVAARPSFKRLLEKREKNKKTWF
ncbi:MRPL25 54S ribosomal protein L25 [Candida maltosa Xu316]|uniref:Mitochondrial ribosomal protein, large subunit, putative n=1 Tax=Candida maltosa (strain Xu316) TaxID=1245528 RepID=M3K373_CANMX|nr:Mitochondrial ribosomal protein, large subunit, putative [Candida maltosa Xu316]